MQTRRMIAALFAAMAVFYLWLMVAQMIWPPRPGPEATSRDGSRSVATGPAATAPAPAASTAPTPTTGPAQAAVQAQPGQAPVSGGNDDTPISLGDAKDDSPYPMALEILPRGASVRWVKIRGHYESVDEKTPYPIIEPVPLTDRSDQARSADSFVTRIRFEDLDLDAPLDNVIWRITETSDEEAVLSVDVSTPDGQPLARVFKKYVLRPQSPEDQTYDLSLSLRIENLSQAPIQAILIQQGAIGFKREQLRGEDRRVVRALWEDGEIVSKGYLRRSVFKHDKKQELGSDDEGTRIAWVAEGNKYFACIMAPAGRTGPDDKPRFARAEAINLTDIKDDSQQERQDLTFQYITNPMQIAAGQVVEVGFDCYIGPKSKPAFQTVPAYQQRNYYTVISESFYFCAPAALVGLMMKLLDAFHAVPPHNYGLAIIILVIVVRAVLHPITKKSQVNMMKMQKQTAALQPKIQAAKEKYANDRVKQNQAVMEVYREAGVNPAGNLLTCLPMLLQIPIWGALWTALAYTIEMRHAPLDGWWIRDLTQPDALVPFGKGVYIPLISFIMNGPLQSFNLLPILLGISQVLQARFMPKGNPAAQASSSPDQLAQQRKMMMFMSVFFVFILYNAPSGLTLYIMASNLFGILEQWRIRQHLAETEQKGVPATPASRGEPKPARKPPAKAPRPKSWFQKRWGELQKQVDEAKRVHGQPRRGKPRR